MPHVALTPEGQAAALKVRAQTGSTRTSAPIANTRNNGRDALSASPLAGYLVTVEYSEVVSNRRRSGRARWRIIAAALAIAPLCVPAEASANYFGPSGGLGCCAYTDNGALYFNQDSTVLVVYGALNYARSVFNSETDMTTGYDSSPDGSTDIEAFDQYYTTYWGLDWDGSDTGSNISAYSKCVNFTTTFNCDQYEQRYDLADVLNYSTDQLRKTALHETGHSVGLDHSSLTDSMMRTGKLSIIHINDHDRAHINGRW